MFSTIFAESKYIFSEAVDSPQRLRMLSNDLESESTQGLVTFFIVL